MRIELALAALLLSGTAAGQSRIYVDASATPGGDGSLAQPFGTLQEAADVAVDGASVHVAPGNYAPFSSPSAISLIGSPTAPVTIRFDGSGPPGCSIGTGGGGSGSTSSIRIENVTFDGLGDLTPERALQFEEVTATIFVTDCAFRGLRGPFGIAGLEFTSIGTAVMERCTFERNVGRCISCEDLPWQLGSVIVRDCRFFANHTGFQLVHVWKDGGSNGLENCSFERNVGTLIDIDSHPRAQVRSSTFQDNRGLAVTSNFFGPEVIDCTFRGRLDGTSLPIGTGALFHNCIVKRSTVRGHAAGRRAPVGTRLTRLEETLITGVDSGPSPLFDASELVHCTLVDNRTAGPAALVSGGELTNCIVWGNDGIVLEDTPNVRHSLVQGGAPGPGNLDADPLFVGPLSGNFELRPGSPCIDAGTPTLGSLGPEPDLGKYQFSLPFEPESGTFCETTTTSSGCVPGISGSAFADLSPLGTTELRVQDLPGGTFGLFFLSTNGWIAAPGELLCVGGPTIRSTVFATGPGSACDGQVVASFTAQELTQLGFLPGDHLRAQFILRDAAHPNGQGVATTAALEMVAMD